MVKPIEHPHPPVRVFLSRKEEETQAPNHKVIGLHDGAIEAELRDFIHSNDHVFIVFFPQSTWVEIFPAHVCNATYYQANLSCKPQRWEVWIKDDVLRLLDK